MEGSAEEDVDQLDTDVKKIEELGVCEWLRCLSWRAPGSDAFLVGTKCDRLKADAKDTAERIDEACQKWLVRWITQGMRINIEGGVSLTSCARPPERSWLMDRLADLDALIPGTKRTLTRRDFVNECPWPCDWPSGAQEASSEGLLRRITHKSRTNTFRGATMVLPRGWDAALTMLEALRMGR